MVTRALTVIKETAMTNSATCKLLHTAIVSITLARNSLSMRTRVSYHRHRRTLHWGTDRISQCFNVRFRVGGRYTLSSVPHHPNRIWGPASPSSVVGNVASFSGMKVARASNDHPPPSRNWSRISGVVPPTSHTSSGSAKGQLHFTAICRQNETSDGDDR